VLWACFHPFGDPPPLAVAVMGYFTGMLGNLLALPGGVGGVEGAMIAAFLAFGVAGGLAVMVVLRYRAFAFWLPLVPGVFAYLRLWRTVSEWQNAARHPAS
jgi:putative heme transporter